MSVFSCSNVTWFSGILILIGFVFGPKIKNKCVSDAFGVVQ